MGEIRDFVVDIVNQAWATDNKEALLETTITLIERLQKQRDETLYELSDLLKAVQINEKKCEDILAHTQNLDPIFGKPSSDSIFACDIFMIMPFAPSFDPVYKLLVKPTVTSLNLSIKRGDDPFSKHEIMFDVWSMLNACKVVIADCTGLNPNVFYELGIAHSLGKPVIMLTQNIAELPFDLRGRRAIHYDTTFHKVDALKLQLEDAIRKILNL